MFKDHSFKRELSLKDQIFNTQTKLAHTLKKLKPHIIIFLGIIPYFQFLAFSFDKFSYYWFQQSTTIFGYLDLSSYMKEVTTYVTASFALAYVMIFWALVIIPQANTAVLLSINKIMLILFSSILFPAIIGHLSFALSENSQKTIGEKIAGGLSLGLFVITICLQSYVSFDYLRSPIQWGITKSSSILVLSFLVMVVINILKELFEMPDDSGVIVKLAILNITFGIHTILYLIKREHKQIFIFKIELYCICINLLAIVMTDVLVFLQWKVRISLWIILIFLTLLIVRNLQIFKMTYLLENINKWNNSLSVINYTSEARNLLYERYNNQVVNFYEDILAYGYIEIHQQKCEEPNCPSRRDYSYMEIPEEKTQQVIRIEELIKNIYNIGLKITPIDPQLQLEFATYLYELDLKEKSLKTLLSIKENELTFSNYYKYFRLKKEIHQQMLEQPHQQFLNLLSELELKHLEEEIMKKFQHAALINLQFWSVLNEDHPDFQKLNEIGNTRVNISEEVHSIYRQICQLAFCQRITDLFVYYLTFIENDEQLYNEVYEDLKEDNDLTDKILIENWSNNSQPVMLISMEDHNEGDIIDINSTCALIFGFEKYELLNRNYKLLFSEKTRDIQAEKFISFEDEEDTIFFIEHKNEYNIKVRRRVKSYSSMQTGLTIFLTITPQNTVSSCFLLFYEHSLVGLSSSCINMLDMERNILEENLEYSSIIKISRSDLTIEKEQYPLNNILVARKEEKISSEIYSIQLFFYGELSTVELIPNKQRKLQNIEDSVELLSSIEFGFEFQQREGNYIFIGKPVLTTQKSKFRSFNFNSQMQKSIQKKSSYRNYGEGIATLRLHENFIKIIEDSEESVNDNEALISNHTNQELLLNDKIGKKDEETIFQNRKSYHNFLQTHSTNNSLKLVLILGIIITFGIYSTYYFLYIQAIDKLHEHYKDISHDNIIIGYISRIRALTFRWEMQAQGKSSQFVNQSFYEFNETLTDFYKNKNQFSTPYPVIVSINNDEENKTFLTDQFLLSYANTADNFLSYFNDSQTTSQIQTAYQSIDEETINYLRTNGDFTKEQLVKKSRQKMNEYEDYANTAYTNNMIMVSGGCLFGIIFGLILVCFISRLNMEKIDILEAFLNITESQIQNFSAKTEKFLITLHAEESPDDFEDGQDALDSKKRESSATFNRKKRFKVIQFSKLIYIKILVVPFLAIAFFIQSSLILHEHFSFMKDSMRYSYLQTEVADIAYTGQSQLQQKILAGQGDDTGLTSTLNKQILQYYRQYFSQHYETFGKVDQFHEIFTNVFMYDICSGTIQIKNACNIQLVSSNGSLLILTDISVALEQNNLTQDFEKDFYSGEEVLSHSHDKVVTSNLQFEENIMLNVKQKLIITFCCWGIVLLVVGIIYGIKVVLSFSHEIIINKSMLKFFPVSMAKSLPEVNKYIKKILNRGGC